MTAIVRAVSRIFYATDQECDSLFPVLMLTAVGLLFSISLVLANEAPPFVEFQIF